MLIEHLQGLNATAMRYWCIISINLYMMINYIFFYWYLVKFGWEVGSTMN